MNYESRQRDAVLRAQEAATTLHELRQEEVRLTDELVAAIKAAYALDIPRPFIAQATGLSPSRTSQYEHDQAGLQQPKAFTGEVVLPPYPGRKAPAKDAVKRQPGTQSAARNVNPDTLAQERELMRQVRVCMDQGMTIRATSEKTGLSKSVVGRYVKIMRSLPPLAEFQRGSRAAKPARGRA
jgi:hypothetical protein